METLRFLAQICHQAIGKERLYYSRSFSKGSGFTQKNGKENIYAVFLPSFGETGQGSLLYYLLSITYIVRNKLRLKKPLKFLPQRLLKLNAL
jgi:hypothetical protein